MRLIVSVLAGVLASTVAGTGTASAQSALNESAAIDWQPCAQDTSADCATMRLPLDYAKPDGPTFDMAVARRKATDPAKRIGTLLVNLGGPGGSGVDVAVSRKDFFSPEIQDRFDVVGWDPRGVKRTAPVTCSPEILAAEPSLYPASQSDLDAFARYNRSVREDCRARSGAIYDHADTYSIVRDTEEIRRGLGDEKVSIYTGSYGNLISGQYAERYGDKIRALVMDSPMDYTMDTWGFARTEATTSESAFDEWEKWCERSTACALHGKDFRAWWHTLLGKADRGELPGKLTAT
ncbi:alpha/beta hydrolase [Kibdelosporangium philippinense]|uniref:Alpha/beta hydrolase n=1 Tax=Kibdelosporangium philippinense TaxID=211113 RepID=A0ABS8ZLY4_9PSEU|nr:alpha/beta fold hydrolase [Kibdelosporangium philippinense]MCE7006792.1 alpha/beta hydrolase [Kibdelosporangium philippinense]